MSLVYTANRTLQFAVTGGPIDTLEPRSRPFTLQNQVHTTPILGTGIAEQSRSGRDAVAS